MAAFLPPEILSTIAEYVVARDDKEEKLGPYALVCKAWQAAFEPNIYSFLTVLSPSDSTSVSLGLNGKYGVVEKHGISLEQLAKLTGETSERCRARRAAIRRILYKVAIPHCLSDDREIVDESSDEEELLGDDDPDEEETLNADSHLDNQKFSYDNTYRRQNNEAFATGMRHLSKLLSTWQDQQQPLSLGIVTEAENIYTPDQDVEPGTVHCDESGRLIAKNCAELPVDHALLPVNCISALDFPKAWSPVPIDYIEFPNLPNQEPSTSALASQNGISPSTALLIASACGGSALKTVSLDGEHRIPRHERELTLQSRNAIADYLPMLPSSVRELEIKWQNGPSSFSHAVHPTHPVYESPPDIFCRALHLASMQLRELHITGMDIYPEFFGATGADSWPNLEVLCVKHIPCTTYFGARLVCRDEDFTLSTMCPSLLEELYSRVGEAACRMPRIKKMEVFYRGERAKLDLSLQKGGGRILSLFAMTNYTPSSRIWSAWKVQPRFISGGGRWAGEEQWQAEWVDWPPT